MKKYENPPLYDYITQIASDLLTPHITKEFLELYDILKRFQKENYSQLQVLHSHCENISVLSSIEDEIKEFVYIELLNERKMMCLKSKDYLSIGFYTFEKVNDTDGILTCFIDYSSSIVPRNYKRILIKDYKTFISSIEYLISVCGSSKDLAQKHKDLIDFVSDSIIDLKEVENSDEVDYRLKYIIKTFNYTLFKINKTYIALKR